MPFEPLGNILPGRLTKHGVSLEVAAAVVCQAFDAAVGELGAPLAGAARAVQFQKGTLIVQVSSSSAASALQMKAAALAAAANGRLGHQAIKEVRIRVRSGG